jgi:O-antigen/teichoic acid export membrane protein
MNTGTAQQENSAKAISAPHPSDQENSPAANGNGSSGASSSAQKIARGVSKGGLAIVDQGLISGSNFLISIFLARWLTQDQYGAYAIAFGIYIMLSLVYQSLVLEPMGVFGGSVFRKNLRGYLRSLVSIHVALSITICAAFVVAWFLAHHFGAGSAMTGALAGVAFASPCLMLFTLARRTFYVELSPAPAAAGAFIYSALILSGLYFVYKRALLSPFTAFLLIAVGALVTGTVLMFVLRSSLSGSGPAPAVGEAWHRHWRYGRWALASCIAGWLPSYIYFPLLSSFTGMAESGQLKALMNLTMPFEQMKGALVMLLLPYAAGVMEQGGKDSARLLGSRMTWLSAFAAIAYWGVIIPLQKPVFHLLYRDRYLEVAYLLPLLALGQIFWSATFGPQVALRAMESPSSVFVALGLATCGSLIIGVPATWFFGLKGAIWGSNAADVFSFVALMLMLRYKLATHDPAPETGSKWLGSKTESSKAMTLEVPEEV